MAETEKKFFGLKCRWCSWFTPFKGRYDISKAYRRLDAHIDYRHDKQEGDRVLWAAYEYYVAEEEADEVEEARKEW